MSKPTRIAIFAHYDKDNIIADYVIRYLHALSDLTQHVYFVSNCSSLSYTELEKIRRYTNKITLRNNIGGDFAGWSTIIKNIDIELTSHSYEELILANDSCYMITNSLTPLFDSMSKKECDMWGITENNAPTYGENKLPITPHIQSYFMVFGKKALSSPIFKEFWLNVDLSFTRDQTIIHYEIGLTELLRSHGLTCCSYIKGRKQDYDAMEKKYFYPQYDLPLFHWRELMERDNPFLKVKAIPIELEYTATSLKKIMRYFKKNNKNTYMLEIHRHLYRTSARYRFSCLPLHRKIYYFSTELGHRIFRKSLDEKNINKEKIRKINLGIKKNYFFKRLRKKLNGIAFDGFLKKNINNTGT